MAVAEPFTVALPKLRGRNRPQFEMLRRIGWLDRAALIAFVLVTFVAIFAKVLAPHSASATPGDPFLAPGHGGFLLVSVSLAIPNLVLWFCPRCISISEC